MDPSLEYACKRIVALEGMLLVDVPETVWPAEVAMVFSQVESASTVNHRRGPFAGQRYGYAKNKSV